MNVIFISVRTGSSRFPQKAIKKINGKATIEHLIERLKKSKYAEKVILCTTELQEDNILCDIAQENNIEFFRGSSPDKLSRWLGATEKYNVDFFVNVDGDDILFDAGLVDICFEQYLETINSGRKIFMILGMMANKEHKEFIQIFKGRIHFIITLDIPNQKNFIEKEKLSKIAQSCDIPSKTENSIEEALKSVAKENENAIIFCTGSLYLAGEILNLN